MYDHLILDGNQCGYQVFKSPEFPDNDRIVISFPNDRKKAYKNFMRNYIDTIELLKSKFLAETGEITLLFDNHHSRDEIKKLLRPLSMTESRKKVEPSYKAQRKPERLEFYNSLDGVRYYYMLSGEGYNSARIDNLEADDLVAPCITQIRKSKPDAKILLVSSDMDWQRYLDDKTSILSDLWGEPNTVEVFTSRYRFEPNPERITLYKIIYGDASDNIKAIFGDLKPDIKDYIIKTFHSTEDFLVLSPSDPKTKHLTDLISDRRPLVSQAYSVLSAIPVSPEHFKAVWVKGRKGTNTMRAILQSALKRLPNETEVGFKFGSKKKIALH